MAEPRTVLTRESEGGAIVAGVAVIQGAATNQAKLPTAAGNRALGITGFKVDAAGKQMSVIVLGHAKAIADAAIAAGDALEVGGTDGHLKPAAPAVAVNANVVGHALTAAAADGDEFEMLVTPSTKQG